MGGGAGGGWGQVDPALTRLLYSHGGGIAIQFTAFLVPRRIRTAVPRRTNRQVHAIVKILPLVTEPAQRRKSTCPRGVQERGPRFARAALTPPQMNGAQACRSHHRRRSRSHLPHRRWTA